MLCRRGEQKACKDPTTAPKQKRNDQIQAAMWAVETYRPLLAVLGTCCEPLVLAEVKKLKGIATTGAHARQLTKKKTKKTLYILTNEFMYYCKTYFSAQRSQWT